VVATRRRQTRDADDIERVRQAIGNEWKESHTPGFEAIKAALRTPAVFDGRTLHDPVVMPAFGLGYHCVGRAANTRQ